MTIQEPASTIRVPEYPADRIFVDRWSPRGFTQDQITEEVLNTCFEAAQRALSAFNSQPWRFLHALRGEPEFVAFPFDRVQQELGATRGGFNLSAIYERFHSTWEDRTAILAYALL